MCLENEDRLSWRPSLAYRQKKRPARMVGPLDTPPLHSRHGHKTCTGTGRRTKRQMLPASLMPAGHGVWCRSSLAGPGQAHFCFARRQRRGHCNTNMELAYPQAEIPMHSLQIAVLCLSVYSLGAVAATDARASQLVISYAYQHTHIPYALSTHYILTQAAAAGRPALTSLCALYLFLTPRRIAAKLAQAPSREGEGAPPPRRKGWDRRGKT